MNLEEKLQVAAQLETLGVDIIEAGFAIASPGDFEAVSEVARQSKTATVASLARAANADIERAWEAVQHAVSPRIHTFIATSPLHMRVKLNKTPEEVLEAIERNNANEYNLATCIEWFNHVSESWIKPTFADGRLKICNDVCGQKNTQ